MNCILIAEMRRLTPIDLFTETTCVHSVTSIDLFRDVSKGSLIHAEEHFRNPEWNCERRKP